jgi:hypothetical protein
MRRMHRRTNHPVRPSDETTGARALRHAIGNVVGTEVPNVVGNVVDNVVEDRVQCIEKKDVTKESFLSMHCDLWLNAFDTAEGQLGCFHTKQQEGPDAQQA